MSLPNVIYSLCLCYLLSSSDVGEGYSIPVGKGKLGRLWSPYSFTETTVSDWFKANANVGPTLVDRKLTKVVALTLTCCEQLRPYPTFAKRLRAI